MSSPARLVDAETRGRLQSAARELLRRQRARDCLHNFVLAIDVPMSPVPAWEAFDEELCGPARFYMPEHHALICDVLQRTVERPMGRCIIMAPPGSAKSALTSVVLPAWVSGRREKYRTIITSYGSDLAEKQSRRAQQIVRSAHYQNIWDAPLEFTREAVSDWQLSNESEVLAAGILAGLTGNRADLIIIDDPVAGRQEADSEAMRKSVLDAYQDDLMTRLLPNGAVCLIMTRWHEDDLAGAILPVDYAGESGMILCRDGLYWEVLNIQAKCERQDDPLGRELGEYLWPEWFPPDHFKQFEQGQSRAAQRTWSSLYQGRPTPQGSNTFDRAWFRWEDPRAWPPASTMRRAIVSDWAVTESAGADFTEHFCWGVDTNGEVYVLDTWSGQVTTDKSIDALLAMAQRNGATLAFDEKGVIHNSVAPALNKAMRKKKVYLNVKSIASSSDKVARVQSFQAIASTGIVHLPDRGKHKVACEQMVDQLIALPAGRHDDKADVAGLLGRVIDQIRDAPQPPDARTPGIKPFSVAWLEYDDTPKPYKRLR